MIAFDEAYARVLAETRPVVGMELLRVEDALGRVLAAPILAGFDVPNHANSAMDGYAVRTVDLAAGGETTLTVVADLPAGERLERTMQAREAVRIMTGAPIPPGCDCVVMQELVRRVGDQVTVPAGRVPGENIRPAGEDIQAGSVVLPRGTRLRPAHLGLLTALGWEQVEVWRRPVVALLSTGNEVVEPGTPLLPGQVYDSNRTTLRAALQALGVVVLDLGVVRDDREAIAAALVRGGAEADAVITTGGVSVGDHDLVKEVLEGQGAIHFWQVAMKPGKPQAYGQLGQARFFGLPGNPVSGLAVFLLIVRPALLRMMGALDEPPRRMQAVFRGALNKKHNRMDFLRGIAHGDEQGEVWVETTGPQGSGILTSFAKANVLIILPEAPVRLVDGDKVRIQWIDHD
ncbi:MAG: molybdopterin molybdotransferase MoeA [Magnetococcales bacterium]|nr:molybdopterin molybdotransferase MoeA [Magnetococcales bacterium]NGZ06045.1 molybdopterin molybdotransferase MoeA [Magnetococcales bacterium]